MADATRTGAAAVAWAANQRRIGASSWASLCLKFVRSCFGVAAKYPNAKIGWENTKYRHTIDDTADIPAGVPVWYKTGTKNWHVVISAGNGGMCYSSDVGGRGKIGYIGINALAKAWGITLLGWSEDINGVRVYTAPAKPAPGASPTGETISLTAVRNPSKNPTNVKRLQASLKKVGAYTGAITGIYSNATRSAYGGWQRSLGYTGNDADGIPGAASLQKLCARAGYKYLR